jgi:hypothetical protein
MKTSMPSIFRSLLLGVALLASAGCGGSGTVSVKGVVTLDGEPLPKATISFMPLSSEGRAAYGVSDAKGNFRLTTVSPDDGIMPGEYKVMVQEEGEEKPDPKTFSEEERKAARMGMKPKGSMSPVAKSSEKKTGKPSLVPAIYHDAKRTPLRQVIPPPGKIEIVLKSNVSG